MYQAYKVVSIEDVGWPLATGNFILYCYGHFSMD